MTQRNDRTGFVRPIRCVHARAAPGPAAPIAVAAAGGGGASSSPVAAEGTVPMRQLPDVLVLREGVAASAIPSTLEELAALTCWASVDKAE